MREIVDFSIITITDMTAIFLGVNLFKSLCPFCNCIEQKVYTIQYNTCTIQFSHTPHS